MVNRFLYQACTAAIHALLVSWNCFCLCIGMCMCVCASVCLSVCLAPRALITSGVIWCDIGRVWLVKPVTQLFSLLLSIKWMGMALVTQHVMHARQRWQSWCRTSNGRRHINYLAVVTRQSASVIKVSRRMCSDKFKRRIGFSFTIIILA